MGSLSTEIWGSFIVVLIFICIHLIATRLHFLDAVPRSGWLSAAGGVSIAYVFTHLLPTLGQITVDIEDHSFFGRIQYATYYIAMAGLVVFYGLERLSKFEGNKEGRSSSRKSGSYSQHDKPTSFWLHMLSFGVYNLIIGYLLLHRRDHSINELASYAMAMGLHFIVNDKSLSDHHNALYRKFGRWALVLCIVVGWLLGVSTNLDEAYLSALYAFLAGGIILNVLKEELPEDRESRFSAFLAGIIIYSALMFLIEDFLA